ncbi:MAG: response regulator [Isosphaeraceae bacterium]|nr:response regulator [Isosphaeraceae bacterium]
MCAEIVLAEDERDLRAVYAACLRASGYVVWEAADGQEAIALVAERRPSLLILDVWMPVLNGFEVLEHIRTDPWATTLKVVMLSNLGDSDTRLECFAVGATDYWVKGLALAELCARVRDLLAEAEVAPSAD